MMMRQTVEQLQVIRGTKITLEQAVLKLLPTQGFIEIQRDLPSWEHPTHTHPVNEILLIVEGSITFMVGELAMTCRSGDQLLLPKHTVHSSVAGPEGCTYLIYMDTEENQQRYMV
ncbi:cupin domain-containing protein [Brevibacillus dissolubilis]|uniref:cupin domain-containing protein n=1 Tax=Brevibacillus dissolubilis TaxID=1844116 RepID=UPI0021006313|nr:cupin domain-containing protein [Brevibacillus dissolubilis]